MRFGSLFSGIGGIDLGLQRAGWQCAWQVENDPYCQRVLAKHWPEVRRHGDIRTFLADTDSNQLRNQPGGCRGTGGQSEAIAADNGEDWRVELIAGGFPCQDISVAGKRVGIQGERSGLFFEAVRVVAAIRPRWVLFENVAALLACGLVDVLGELAAIGYDAEWHCLQAADLGAPHIRDRVFIISYPQGIGRRPRRPWRTAGVSSRQENPPELACTNKPRQGKWWSVEPSVGRVANGVPFRVDRLRGLGNAVVPQVAEWIGREMLNRETSAG